MHKKLIILAVFVMPLRCSAGLGEYLSAWWHGKGIAAVPLPHIPLTPQQNATVVGGVASHNALEIAKEVRGTIKDVLEHPENVAKASQGLSHGFTRGFFTGPASAIRDGVTEHPYATAVVVTAAAGTAVYYKLKPLSEEEQQLQQIEKDKRLAAIRKAASIARADEHADDYRRCLSRHAHDKGSCEDRIRRCHSPAGRLAAENRKMADEITESYRTYNR